MAFVLAIWAWGFWLLTAFTASWFEMHTNRGAWSAFFRVWPVLTYICAIGSFVLSALSKSRPLGRTAFFLSGLFLGLCLILPLMLAHTHGHDVLHTVSPGVNRSP